MKITLDISDDIIAELQREAAELTPIMTIETLAAWYLRLGMLLDQQSEQEVQDLREAERRLFEQIAKRKRNG